MLLASISLPLAVCVCLSLSSSLLAGDKEGVADLPHHKARGVGDLLAGAGGAVCDTAVLDSPHSHGHQGGTRGGWRLTCVHVHCTSLGDAIFPGEAQSGVPDV